jgi:mitochondrial chaperone BCS1
MHDFLSNPIISGGLVLAMIGSAMAMMKSVPAKLFESIKNRILVTVEIDNTDPAFPWVKSWLAEQGRSSWMAAGIQADASNGMMPKQHDPSERPRFSLCPRGIVVFRYRGRRIVAWLTKEQVQQSKEWRETIALRVFRAPPEFFREVLNDAYEFASGRDGSTIQVWVPDGNYWRLQSRKPSRNRDTLLLADGIGESVIDDAKRFMKEQAWYRERGIPWRRGYMLCGPPGTGKSSLAHVLASELRMNVNVATMASFFTDEQMVRVMSNVPSGHVLLLEDIDATRRDGAAGPSFSSLLNVIDGLAAQDGRILIMTTNHPEKLDAALTRPGRVDVKVYIGCANRHQAEKMFLKFFPGHTQVAGAFGDAWSGQSMAEIQKHLLAHRHCPEDAISRGMTLAA